jgi:signal transduction histidine kinase
MTESAQFASDSVRKTTWLGITLLALSCLTLTALNFYQTFAIQPAIERDRGLVTHTFEVIATAQQLDTAIQDAERGQRGFLITADQTYLEPYLTGSKGAPGLVAKFKQLTSDNPDQQRRIAVLGQQIDTKLAELAQTLEARKSSGFEAAKGIVQTNQGLDTMRAITDLIRDAVSAEDRLLADRLSRARDDERSIGFLAESGVALTLIALFIGSVLMWMAYREWTRQNRAFRQIQAKLAQSQKMETLGQLAGGIAHDFNNIIATIKGGINLLKRRVPMGNPDAQRFMEGIELSADRAAALTQRLLSFARRQPLAPEPVEPNRIVANMSELLQRTLGEKAAIETVLAAGLWWISIDANQLENAILNLAVNARDAMPDGGKLTIETANVFLDEPYAASREEVKPGQYAMIAVSDTGTGMSPATVRNAFEPFFTTKPVGKGTGLGLSQVYGFVKQSSGHIQIYSEVGKGTTVKLYLPRLLIEGTNPLPRVSHPMEGPPTRALDGQCILLVEDDEHVLMFTAEMLSEMGYRVLTAPDGPSALRILDTERNIQLLFTDVGLPNDMTGRQLADECCRRRPELKVLFMTGYARNAIVHHGRLDPGVELILKPFTQADLAQKIRTILSASPAG